MEDSILKHVREILVGDKEDIGFDSDLILYINMALNTLSQIGLKYKNGFIITGEDEKWGDLTGNDKLLELVKSYVVIKVRTLFDPPTSSFVLDALTKQVTELEYRINITVDDQSGEAQEGYE